MPNKQPALSTNAYTRWLGIPAPACPPNGYGLLGIPLFEADAGVIQEATDAKLNQLALASAADETDHESVEALRRLIRKASAVLMDPIAKKNYDDRLRKRRAIRAEQAAPVEPAPVTVTPPVADTIAAGRSGIPVWGVALLVVNTAVLSLLAAFVLLRDQGTDSAVADNPGQDSNNSPQEQHGGSERGGTQADLTPGAAEGSGETPTGRDTPEPPVSAGDRVAQPEALADESDLLEPAETIDPARALTKIVNAATLPPLDARGESERTISLGEIAVMPEDREKLSVRLDGGAVKLESREQLVLSASVGEAAEWRFLVADRNGSITPDQKRPLARLFLDERGRLRFQWMLLGNRRSAALQMANAALMLSLEDSRHRVTLREPVGGERVSVHLVAEQTRHALPAIDAMPPVRDLRFDLIGMTDSKLPVAVEGFRSLNQTDRDGTTLLGEIEVVLGRRQHVLTTIGLTRGPDGALSFLITPRFARAVGKKRRYEPLTLKVLGMELLKQRRFAAKQLAAYIDAVRRAPQVEKEMLRFQAIFRRNPRNAGAGHQAKTLSSLLQSLVKTANTNRKKMPETYRILGHYSTVASIAEAMHYSDGLGYRLYVDGSEGPIELLLGDGKPRKPAPQYARLIDPGVTGRWLRLNPPAVYEFGAGVVRIESGGRAVTGSWRQDKERVEVLVNGKPEVFELLEDVRLRGTDDLYKFPKT